MLPTCPRAGDPVLAGAEATRRAVRENVDQARAPLLPQLNAGIVLDQTRDPERLPVRARSRDASATLTQVIVDVARLRQLAGARATAQAQEALTRAAEQALAVRVATAYFGVLMAMDTLANTEANEAAYGQQVAQSEQRYRNGLTAQVNVDQAKAYHASARAGTIAARQALADAREALAEITGRRDEPLKTLADDVPPVPPQPADAQAWVSAALAGNPLLDAQQRERVAAADKAVDAARAGHLPTVRASLDVGRPASWPPVDGNGSARTVTTAAILLDVPLFAGGAVQSQLRQALALRDAAADDLEATRRRVARETLERHGSVMAGLGQVEANRAAVAAARRALASTRAGQELGTQTMTDLLLAIQTLTAAQGAYSQSRHRVVLDGLLLRQSAGSLGEADLAAVNTLLR